MGRGSKGNKLKLYNHENETTIYHNDARTCCDGLGNTSISTE